MLIGFCAFENIWSHSRGPRDPCRLSRRPHSKLRVWASTSDFPAFSLSGPSSSFPPKLCEGSLGGHSSCFRGRTLNFEKSSKRASWKPVLILCSLPHSLCDAPVMQIVCLRAWSQALLSSIEFGSSIRFPGPWTWTQNKLMFHFCCCFLKHVPLGPPSSMDPAQFSSGLTAAVTILLQKWFPPMQ